MQANGYWMGSAVPNSSKLNFKITAYDPDPGGNPLRLALYKNGLRVASTTIPSRVWYQWNPTVSGALGHYYYVEAYYDNWYYPAYSSPIWVERAPLARADASPQIVAPGAGVTLSGSNSWDPDGDALAYRWVQQSGSPVSLNGANSGQPTFTAPATVGDLTFGLTVVDTGSLSDSGSVTVTVTDKPISKLYLPLIMKN